MPLENIVYYSLVFSIIAMLCISLYIVVKPKKSLHLMQHYQQSSSLYLLAISARLLLGTLLLLYSEYTSHPNFMFILGAIIILSAMTFSFMGPRRFSTMLAYFLQKFSPWLQISAIFSVVLLITILYFIVHF